MESSKVYLLGQFAGRSEQEHVFDFRTLLFDRKTIQKTIIIMQGKGFPWNKFKEE